MTPRGEERERFLQLFWRVLKRPIPAFAGSALVQSAAAAALNLWCLVLAVLGQFWVIFSAVLLVGQTYNTWRVAHSLTTIPSALFTGLMIVMVNLGALSLAVLGQFWVFASTTLAIWQFACLVRVCVARQLKLDQSCA
jgi:hypothetical protein